LSTTWQCLQPICWLRVELHCIAHNPFLARHPQCRQHSMQTYGTTQSQPGHTSSTTVTATPTGRVSLTSSGQHQEPAWVSLNVLKCLSLNRHMRMDTQSKSNRAQGAPTAACLRRGWQPLQRHM
jgi:hypothetical protein